MLEDFRPEIGLILFFDGCVDDGGDVGDTLVEYMAASIVSTDDDVSRDEHVAPRAFFLLAHGFSFSVFNELKKRSAETPLTLTLIRCWRLRRGSIVECHDHTNDSDTRLEYLLGPPALRHERDHGALRQYIRDQVEGQDPVFAHASCPLIATFESTLAFTTGVVTDGVADAIELIFVRVMIPTYPAGGWMLFAI